MSTIKRYGKNLIKVRLWAHLAICKGIETEAEVKLSIQSFLKITPRQLTAYLENTSQPSIEELFVIAQMLECSLDDLVEAEEIITRKRSSTYDLKKRQKIK